jgi:6-pyruvoyltetrahydropterin/6-carboxytetrahydropterin synthase
MPGDSVRLTRRVGFSSGHRYWLSSLSADENRSLFGPWASPYNHGHNYLLDVTVEGTVEPRTAMVVNIKRIDDCLQQRVVAEFDGKSINDEVPWFHDRASSVENLLIYFADRLRQPGALPAEAELVKIGLQETPTLWGEWNRDGTMTLTRSYEFAASHRLHVPDMTEEENVALFGKCNNAAGHGHNYILEVTVTGEPDARSGMMIDLGTLDAIVEAEVVDRYDHKNLNCDLPEFAGRITTTEIVVQEIFVRLRKKIPLQLKRIKLWETARNAFEVEV